MTDGVALDSVICTLSDKNSLSDGMSISKRGLRVKERLSQDIVVRDHWVERVPVNDASAATVGLCSD